MCIYLNLMILIKIIRGFISTLRVFSPHPNPHPGGARGLSGHIFRLCHQSEPAIGRLWCPFTLPC
ncbi:TPA: hypothetical protein F6S97_05350 [Escherichia coli]|nr:hypothetical protein [Escherichia coli]